MSDAPRNLLASGTLLAGVDKYYSAKVAEHGANHRGVDWNSKESQELRFEQLLKVVDALGEPFSINDYGCGYGALRDYLDSRAPDCRYRGFDLSQAMLAAARRTHPNVEAAAFADDASLLSQADYTVASGVFNVRLETEDSVWLDYVLETIGEIAKLSARGFAFNMLTLHSDAERMRRTCTTPTRPFSSSTAGSVFRDASRCLRTTRFTSSP